MQRALLDILPRCLLQRSCQQSSYRELVQGSLVEIFAHTHIAKRSAEILPKGLLHRSCHESCFRQLVQRSHTGIFPRDLMGSLYRDLAKRPHTETCTKIFPRGLLRSCQQSSYRDLVKWSCQETSYRNLAQRPGEENRDPAQRSCIESLNTNLTLRSLTEIFSGDFL